MSAAAEDSGDGEVTPLLADMIETGLWIMALSGENHTVWLEPLPEELSAVVDTADGVGRFCSFDGRRWSPVDDGLYADPVHADTSVSDAAYCPSFLSPRKYRPGSPSPSDPLVVESDDVATFENDLFLMHRPLLGLYETLVATGWRVRVRYIVPADSSDRGALHLRADAPRSDRLYNKIIQDALGTVPPPVTAVAVWREQGADRWDFDPHSTGFLPEVGPILERSPDVLTDYALAAAPEWTLAPGVDQPAQGSPAPSRTGPWTALTPPASPTDAELAARKQAIRTWAEDNGFWEEVVSPTPKKVQAVLEARGSGTAGYYLLEFANGQCYVGQSVNIDKRLGQHRLNHSDIVSIRVKPDTAVANATNVLRHLLREERRLIHSVQRAGLYARNKSEMTVVAGDAQLDDLIPPAAQLNWLADPPSGNDSDLRGGRQLDPSSPAFAGSDRNFTSLQTLLGSADAQAFRLLGVYLARCIPVPNATEIHYWTLSAPKSAYRGGSPARWRTLWCLCVGFVETFVLLKEISTGAVQGFIQVNGTEFFGDTDAATGYLRLKRQHPGCEIVPADYHDSGPDNVLIDFPNLNALERLLSDDRVTRAAATASLLLMRVRRSPSTRQQTHCPALVGAGWSASGPEAFVANP